jgi:Do/DeqQ family serine protease
MNKKQYWVSLILAAFLGALLALGLSQWLSPIAYTPIEVRQQNSWANQRANAPVRVPEGIHFIHAANAVRPAVVHIRTGFSHTAEGYETYEESNRKYHGEDFPAFPRTSSGSGVILTNDGYVVTNNHVVDEAGTIEIILNDKRTFKAKIIGTDPGTDLALLKIDAENLPFARFGDTEALQIGEWVLAIGNPFDLTSTVTAGIISGTGRNINLLKDEFRGNNYAIESFIQTDAAINPGNSGGALINLKGELIGVNTAIATHTGFYAGYSFAIPVSIVKKVMNDLIRYGEAQRALLGVSVHEINADLAKKNGLASLKGVFINALSEDGAAKSAGLQKSDIILQINQKEINSFADLQANIVLYSPGEKVEIIYLRKGTRHTARVVLRNKQGKIEISRKSPPNPHKIMGAELSAVSPLDKSRLDLTHGVKVDKIGRGKLRESGMREGFVITHVGGKPMSAPQEVIQALVMSEQRHRTIAIEGFYASGSKAYYAIGW